MKFSWAAAWARPVPAASIHLKETAVLAKTEHICPLQEELREMQPPADADGNPERGQLSRLPSVTFEKAEFVTEGYDYEEDYKSTPLEARQFVETLTEEQLIRLATGETAGDSGSQLGSAGMYVPGSAAETSRCGEEQELAAIVLADGPAGLRLARSYQVKDGRVLPNPPGMGMGKRLSVQRRAPGAGRYVLSVLHRLPCRNASGPDLGSRASGALRAGRGPGDAGIWRDAVAGAGHEHPPESPLRQKL